MDDENKHVFKLHSATYADSARLPSRHTAAGSVFYAFDPQGNAVQQLNGAGAVIGAAMYDSYGSATSAYWAANMNLLWQMATAQRRAFHRRFYRVAHGQ